MRPVQWVKNLLLFAPLVFSKVLFSSSKAVPVGMGIAAFCLLSSSIYLFNDVVDRKEDRLHPLKGKRPVARGSLLPREALGFSGVLAVLAFGISMLLPASFTLVLLLYLALQIAYTLVLKRLFLMDAFTVGTGFVFRLLAGAEAAAVPVSAWLLGCTLLLAILLSFGKRRYDLASTDRPRSSPGIESLPYTLPFLDRVLLLFASVTIGMYILYTLSDYALRRFHAHDLAYTIPFAIFGILRYLYLVRTSSGQRSPEALLLKDLPTLINLVLYGATVLWVIYR